MTLCANKIIHFRVLGNTQFTSHLKLEICLCVYVKWAI